MSEAPIEPEPDPTVPPTDPDAVTAPASTDDTEPTPPLEPGSTNPDAG
jgi:hypothetical protein